MKLAELFPPPHASYLYLAPTRGYNGRRLALSVHKETREAGELEKFKEEARERSIPLRAPPLRQWST